MWISWTDPTTERPNPNVTVEVVFRDGAWDVDFADNYDWTIADDADDIMAYRVISDE